MKKHALISLAVITALAGCASPPPPPPPPPASYVVLLDNDDGTTGKVLVTTAAGETLLEKPRQATRFASPAGATFEVTQDKLNADFAAAMASAPVKPVSFLLYFAVGGAKLTPESEAMVAQLLNEIAAHPAADISVIGHTDTAGDAEANEKLGLDRARFVADLIEASKKIVADRVAIESHGEKNLLVPTPDNTNEPKNRRVEVVIR